MPLSISMESTTDRESPITPLDGASFLLQNTIFHILSAFGYVYIFAPKVMLLWMSTGTTIDTGCSFTPLDKSGFQI